MKLTWVADIHLNFIDLNIRKKFYKSITNNNTDAILISGDIAEAPSVSAILIEMLQYSNIDIYFVLGNHDYYRGSIDGLREDLSNLCHKYIQLHWLPNFIGIKLTQKVVLVGEDCWADGRYGNYSNSCVKLNDSRMIKELYKASICGKYQLLDEMQKLSDYDAERLKKNLERSIQQYNPEKIIILIHVPPFKESCMHEGRISNDDYLPFFSSKVTGDILLDIATRNPTIEFLVLCGHTHSKSYFKPLSNLIVKTGSAKYLEPEIQEIIEVEKDNEL